MKMNSQENKSTHELRFPDDFYPIAGKREYQERNRIMEKENILHYASAMTLLGVYNLVILCGTAIGIGTGLEKLFELMVK